MTEGGIDRILEDLSGFEHDVLHQVSTIAVLAELLGQPGISEPQRELRARQLMGEIRWLRRLVRTAQRRSIRACAVTGPSTEVPLHELVAGVIATTRLMTKARLQLVVEPVSVRGSRVTLGRAVRNLVWNAIDAAGPHGDVHVRLHADGDAAVLEIHNTVRRSVPNGTGIGLYVVRGVASALGGTVQIKHSARSHCVALRLPIVPAGGAQLCAS